VLAREDLAPAVDLADVGDVGEQVAQAALAPRIALVLFAILHSPGFSAPASAVDGLDHTEERFLLQVEVEHGADLLGLGRIDDELGP